MTLLDRIKQDKLSGPVMLSGLASTNRTPTVLRVHRDVTDLALELVVLDRQKLEAASSTMFMPASATWLEWPMSEGDMGLMFLGEAEDPADDETEVQRGRAVFYAWRFNEDEPTGMPVVFDLAKGDIRIDLERWRMVAEPSISQIIESNQSFAGIRTMLFALLALINSPKVVKRVPSNLDRLNRKREAAGRYTFHPHHTVRLNVDRKSIKVGEGHGGDGASRALHFVRAHLRLWEGRYILVKPHWRGDPAVGIRQTEYEVDRQHSRWAS